MATDVHTHLLPQRLAKKIRAFFDDFLIDQDLAYTLDYPELLSRHVEDGIDTIWNLPYAHKPGMAAALNESMLEVADECAGYGVTFVSGCTVHPDDPDPGGDVRDAYAAGSRVLKLHCSVGDYNPDDPRLAPVYDAAAEVRMPVTIHAGHSITGHTEASELAPIAAAVAAHPETTFILAHSGHHAYDEAIELLAVHPNLYCDLTPVTFEPVPLTAADAERHSDRILFGTDAPNTGRTATELLNHIRSTGLSESAFDKITSTNATSLLQRAD